MKSMTISCKRVKCHDYVATITWRTSQHHTRGPMHIRCCASKKSRLNICKTNRAHFKRSTKIWACVFDLWFLFSFVFCGRHSTEQKRREKKTYTYWSKYDLKMYDECVILVRTLYIIFFLVIDLLITARKKNQISERV